MRLAIYILVRAKAVIDLALGVIAHARHPAYDAGIFVALLQRLDRLLALRVVTLGSQGRVHR